MLVVSLNEGGSRFRVQGSGFRVERSDWVRGVLHLAPQWVGIALVQTQDPEP